MIIAGVEIGKHRSRITGFVIYSHLADIRLSVSIGRSVPARAIQKILIFKYYILRIQYNMLSQDLINIRQPRLTTVA